MPGGMPFAIRGLRAKPPSFCHRHRVFGNVPIFFRRRKRNGRNRIRFFRMIPDSSLFFRRGHAILMQILSGGFIPIWTTATKSSRRTVRVAATPPETSPSPKGKGNGAKPSPGMKILLRIILIVVLFAVYYHIANAVVIYRVGFREKMGNEIESASAIRNLLLDNPSVFFTGKADAAQACVWTPEMRRWNGLYLWLRGLSFTLGRDAKEWSIFVFTEKEEDVEKIRRELASMISELDVKLSVLCVRLYHIFFLHSSGPSTWSPEKLEIMPFYADYRLDLDNL